MRTLRAGGSTDVGRVRSSNEDAYFVGDGLYAVADGVGGHQAGEVASATAIEALSHEFTTRTVDGLVEAFHAANDAVWTLAQESTERRGMGTTLTAVALVTEDGDEVLALANVGDSRGYLLQGGDLIQVTEDHSLVGELVREGQITEAEARVHPRRSIITRAMGMAEQIEVDTWTVDPAVGDRILLCSDGLTNEVSDDRIAAALRRLRDPGDCADELVRLARAGGGNDNITVVVVDVVDDDIIDSTAVHSTAGVTTSPPEDTGPVEAAEILDDPAPDHWAPGPASDESPPAAAVPPAPSPRRLTWRVLAFGAVALAIVGLGVAALAWYARGSYFVGLDGDRVAIFQGRPGGLLWFQPTLEQVTDLDAADVAPARRAELADGKARTSLEAARQFVDALADEAERLGLTEPTTPTTVPTTDPADSATTDPAGSTPTASTPPAGP